VSSIKKIMEGPMEWFNARTGSWRVVDEVHKGLVEQFQKAGYLVDISIWTLGECRCKPCNHHADNCRNLIPIPEAYQFGVTIMGKTEVESGFDFDRMVHEVQSNLLGIPGEGGVIKFDEAAFLRQQRERGGHGH
jgi:hypothetical protein